MLYIFVFLVLNVGSIAQSYVSRPREKVHSKRNLDIYPNIARLNEGYVDKETGAGGGDGGNGADCPHASKACNSAVSRIDAKSKATNIAQKAAQEAKAASDAQITAADAAASHVKAELADKALQSARAAEAALAGKQQIVEQLERENSEAEAIVQQVNNSLQNTQMNAAAANSAAEEARNQLRYLRKLVEAFVKNLENIETVANGEQQELAEKAQLLEAAKNRVQSLSSQLEAARQDYDKTKKSAYKAACAAVDAKQKAQRNKRKSSSAQ